MVTGGSRGIGRALVEKHLELLDRVWFCSRGQATAARVERELKAAFPGCKGVRGFAADVTSADDMLRLAKAAAEDMGSIDIWINNAGISTREGMVPLVSCDPAEVGAIVDTNSKGVLFGTRAAMRVMGKQATGGHIFNMEGAGSDGRGFGGMATYSMTKASMRQLLASMQSEVKNAEFARKADLSLDRIRVHNVSPGMVLTDLLLRGNTQAATTQAADVSAESPLLQSQEKAADDGSSRRAFMFNILCERASTVAEFLVPRIRAAQASGRSGQQIAVLDTPGVLYRFLTMMCRKDRFFVDGKLREEGDDPYSPCKAMTFTFVLCGGLVAAAGYGFLKLFPKFPY